MRHKIAIVALFVIAGCAPGCNLGCNPGCNPGCGPTAENVRQGHIRGRGENFIHSRSPGEIYALVLEPLTEEGFAMPAGPPPLNVDIASDWKQLPREKSQAIVRFIPLKGGHLVHILEVTENDTGIYRHRWPELEWELILRSEPDRAMAITREAEKRADRLHRRQNQ